MTRAAIAAVVAALVAAAVAQPAGAALPDATAQAGWQPESSGAEATYERWQPGVRRAERYARNRQGDVRFAIIDLAGEKHGFRAKRTAPAASVFKVMLMVAYLRQPSVRDRDLREADRDLLGPMIRRSDNVAATRVRDIVGRRRVERLADRAGMRHFRYHEIWGLSRTNPNDQVRFMHRLERYVPDRHERYARKLLASIVESQRWGVAREVPDGWKLRFKGGWGSGTGRVDHQVAFLERDGHRLALAVFTEFNPSHSYGKRTLREVAERLLRGLPTLPWGS